MFHFVALVLHCVPGRNHPEVCHQCLLKQLLCTAVKQSDKPSVAEVDRIHAEVIEAITQLYEEHKHLIPGWESRPLHII